MLAANAALEDLGERGGPLPPVLLPDPHVGFRKDAARCGELPRQIEHDERAVGSLRCTNNKKCNDGRREFDRPERSQKLLPVSIPVERGFVEKTTRLDRAKTG